MKRALALAELQLETLLCFDARRRMTVLNQPDRTPAPWLFLVRTAEGNPMIDKAYKMVLAAA